MSEDPFDRLLDAMPKIADAVNAFGSEEVQRRAFDALIATLGAVPPPAIEDDPAKAATAPGAGANQAAPAAPAPDEDNSAGGGKPKSNARRQRGTGARRVWTANRDINFNPPGKTSLRELAEEKKPANHYDRYLVVGHFMTETLGNDTFSISDVLGGYKLMGWKVPTDPANTIHSAASTNGWFDTSDTTKIRITHLGQNAIDHELPRNAKK